MDKKSIAEIDNVCAFLYEDGQIFYYHHKQLKGLFILWLSCANEDTPTKDEVRAFKIFLERTSPEDIYFATPKCPDYIKNHCEYHGNYGNRKVYKYAR